MLSSLWPVVLALQALFCNLVHARCSDPSPAFQLPPLNDPSKERNIALNNIQRELQRLVSQPGCNGTSVSIEVTSSTQSLFSIHHTASVRNESRPGAVEVDQHSQYRIASVTKAFTVFALLHLHGEGRLDLDDPINRYLPELNETQSGTLPWKDITLRALASQLSGIPRDAAIVDFLPNPEASSRFGLPPVSSKDLLQCFPFFLNSCSPHDLFTYLKAAQPLFAPNSHAVYSNINYALLALAIEKATGTPYPEYLEHEILQKILGMEATGFDKPPDAQSVIPPTDSWWDFEIGVYNGTGGLYSNTHDLAKFMQYTLTHYNSLVTGLNWFNPTAYSTSPSSFYGMPWEILRTAVNKITAPSSSSSLQTSRPVTFLTKGGGLPGYGSIIAMIPEYGLGFTVLVAGNMDIRMPIIDTVAAELVLYAESIIRKELTKKYVGTYVADAESKLNSSLSIVYSSQHGGLEIVSWISNGTDARAGVVDQFHGDRAPDDEVTLYLFPTLLYQDEKKQSGEKWRVAVLLNEAKKQKKYAVFDDFCVDDVDNTNYAGKPLNEIVFFEAENSTGDHGKMETASLTGFRIDLHRSSVGDALQQDFGGQSTSTHGGSEHDQIPLHVEKDCDEL